MILTTRHVRLFPGLLLAAAASLAACGSDDRPGSTNRDGPPQVQFLEVQATGGDPASGAQLLLIGDEWRRARPISASAPLTATLRAVPGHSLRFSYGLQLGPVDPGSDVTLRVRLEGRDGETREKTYEISPLEETFRWRQAGVPLDGLGEQAVDVRWDLLGVEGAADVACAVGEVSVVRPGKRGGVVLLVTSDTHRGDHLGAARDGAPVITPSIDALAGRGILFEDCLSPSNLTNPSHIAIMTGTHPRDTGIVTNYTSLTGEAPTLAEAFRSAGYITYAAVSTRHLIDSVSGLGQGFERFAGPSTGYLHTGPETLAYIRKWVRESPGLPLFIWMHLFDPHTPYAPDEADVARYYPDPETAFDPSRPVPEWATEKALSRLGLKDLRDPEFPLALYRAEVSGVDRVLGKLLEMKELAGAVVALTADHGESLGNHEIYFAHKELYRESLHVPLVLGWPGAPAGGARSSHPVSNVDLGRTLLDISGNRDVPFPGRNLADVARQERAVAEPRFTLASHAREVALTHAGWHLQLRLEPNELLDGRVTRQKHQVELYYLPDDPECADDLLERELERAKEMRGRVLRWLEGRGHTDWRAGEVTDETTLKNLRTIGYTVGEQSGPIDLAVDPLCGCGWCNRFRR